METQNRGIMNWIRYSGVSVCLHLNPLHWKIWFWFRNETNAEWPGPNERTYAFGLLFLTVRVWIDDGSW